MCAHYSHAICMNVQLYKKSTERSGHESCFTKGKNIELFCNFDKENYALYPIENYRICINLTQ